MSWTQSLRDRMQLATAAAKQWTDEQSDKYVKYLEHRIQINDCVHGSKLILKRGRIEGTGNKKHTTRDVPPVAVAVRVDHNRAFVYNVKHETRTVPVPIPMALATVRFLNEQQRTA